MSLREWRMRFCPTIATALAVATVGCSPTQSRVELRNPFPAPFSVAVAPILNFSGKPDFDALRAADLLASELTYVRGITVLPVNRVIAALAAEGKQQVQSPAHAIALAESVGADAILVAGITEYDAYTPIIGLALQMYVKPIEQEESFDALAASRQLRAFTVTDRVTALKPVGQGQQVYNASYDEIRAAVKKFAQPRTESGSPYGWQAYLKIQELYLRFCWHDALSRLLEQESRRQRVTANGQAESPA